MLKASKGLSKLLFISYLIKGSMKASRVIVDLCQWQLKQLDDRGVRKYLRSRGNVNYNSKPHLYYFLLHMSN